MPTEPRDPLSVPPADPTAGDPVASGEPAATEGVAATGETPAPPVKRSGDQDGGRGRRRQRGGHGQGGERQRRPNAGRDGRGDSRGGIQAQERPPEKDPAQVKAQALYAASLDQVYAILYNPNIKRQAEDGVSEEKIPAKDWSYAATTRAVAKSKLGFDYDVEPPAGRVDQKQQGRKKKKRERPYKAIDPRQDLEEHEEALDQLGLLVGERFTASTERLQALLSEVNAAVKAFVGDGDKDAVLKAKVGRPGTTEAGEPLESRMLRNKTQLEWKRVDAIRDAVDWYGARVSQIEDAMKALSKRTEAQESVEDRIAKVFTDTAFRKQVELLSKGKAWVQSLINLDIDCPEADQAIIKRLIASQVQRAMRAVAKFEADQKFFLKLDTQDEKTKLNPIDTIKDRVYRIMLGDPIADDFIRAADQRLIGLSPDQELNFWQSVLDLFDEVEEQPNKDDFKLPDDKIDYDKLKAARLARIIKINETLGISTEMGGRRKLLNPDDQAEPEEGLPKGFGQVVERCRRDALLLVELKKALWKTNAILGPNTKKLISGIMRSHPNQEKMEAIIGPEESEGKGGFNGLISKKQLEAVRLLGQMPKELKGEITDEQRATYTAQKEAAEGFAALLAGRKVQDLKWRNVADRPVMTQIRVKLHELLEIGTMDELDAEALEELLFPEPEEAKGKKPDVVVVPWVDEIFGKRLPAELFVDINGEATGITAEHVRAALKEYSGRLVKAFQVGDKDPLAGGLNREVFKQFKLLQPEELNFASLNVFIETIKLFVEACERDREIFPDTWLGADQFGLRIPGATPDAPASINVPAIVKVMEAIKAGSQPLAALLELGKAAAEAASAERATAFATAVEASGLAPAEPEEPDASEPTRLLVEQMFNGTVDAAMLTEAYPHEDGKTDITSEWIKTSLLEDLAAIETVASGSTASTALREAVMRSLHYVVVEGSTPAETVGIVLKKLDQLQAAFVGMKQVFGETWVTDCGLINNLEADLPYVDETLLRSGLRAFANDEDALNAFWFDEQPIARERLLNQLDPTISERFTKLEIPKADQVVVLMGCVPRRPDEPRPQPNQAFGRLAKLLEFGNVDKATGLFKKTGRDLLQKLHLVEIDEGDVLYKEGAILEAINNESFDD